jgi:hypothetical protein
LAVGTQAVYIDAVRRLAAHYRRSPDRLTEEEVRRYLLGVRVRGLEPGTFKSYQGGIQFLYLRTLDRDWALFQKRIRPHKQLHLPEVLSDQRSERCWGGARNPVHKDCFALMYALRLAHKRGRDVGDRRHRPRQSIASRHRQGR